jgi:hypothetical protein
MSTEQHVNLMNSIKSLHEQTVNCSIEEFIRIKMEIDHLYNQLIVLDRPELKGRICPLCEETFDGYGNNPAPLEVNDNVCDNCNMTQVIPARFADDEDDE